MNQLRQILNACISMFVIWMCADIKVELCNCVFVYIHNWISFATSLAYMNFVSLLHWFTHLKLGSLNCHFKMLEVHQNCHRTLKISWNSSTCNYKVFRRTLSSNIKKWLIINQILRTNHVMRMEENISKGIVLWQTEYWQASSTWVKKAF